MIDWLSHYPAWLATAIFLSAFLECLAIVGLLIPGSSFLLVLGVAAGHGVLGLPQTLGLAFVGGMLGNLISYGIGRYFEQDIRRWPLLQRHPQWLGKAENYLEYYGVAGLLAGRFIAPLRPTLPLIAGMLEMPFFRFAIVTLVASTTWALAYVLPSWSAGAAWRLPLPEGFWMNAGILAGALALLLLFGVQQTLNDRPLTTTLMALFCALELFALLLAVPCLQPFDQGLLQIVQDARETGWDSLVTFITGLGEAQVQVLAGGLLLGCLLLLRQGRALRFASATLIGTATANFLIKHGLQRARPEVLLQVPTSYSFPSGHSSAAFALFFTLAVLAGRHQVPRMRLTWLLLATLPAACIALSRIYLGAHWPTDILAGALLAGACCCASLAISDRYGAGPIPPLPQRAWLIFASVGTLVPVAYVIWLHPDLLHLYRR